ncbi:ferredoxin reductase family protein [Altererythrobacter sp. KTW20L]|uniref:ferredoxin reductase family protein n=1 Tax=Altererythrobacter sp. KTW20L TaxID=2942210 RepID=UPI0020BE9DF8|nr:ferredoxin reductase family protein [Altererythrobacter sp. KTW20L]MCL6252070.1 ferredoxin reductase family protein [Altererythrobacter sp. KTW20L]
MRATGWIALYLAIVTLPLLVLLFGDDVPPGYEFGWDLAKALGFAAMSMFGVQFALTARFHAATAPFGIDIIYFLHRYLAIAALVLVLAHFAIFWIWYQDSLGELNPLVAPWHMTAGRAALLAFIAAVITSEFREKLHLEYGLWRFAHIVLAVGGFALAAGHILGVGYYTEAPLKRALWLSFTLSWVLLIVWVRIVRPAIQQRRPYRVSEVRQEGDDAWTLVLEPEGHRGWRRFQPGQFAWLTLKASPWLTKEHPFSLSSAPHQLPTVEMTIKDLGDFTGTISETKVGDRAYLDGPFGIFSYQRVPRAEGFVFIVGGVGITPVISMLRSMAHEGETRPVWLFYANPDLGSALFKDEIDTLARQLNVQVLHIVQEAPPDWTGHTGLLTQEMLEEEVPEELRQKLHYFLCGPPPMLEAAEAHLTALTVPRRHIHAEIFNL